MKFKVILREDPLDGGYIASCPALPGCHSQGETTEEAIENVKDAIEGCLAVLNRRAKKQSRNDRVVEMTAAWQS